MTAQPSRLQVLALCVAVITVVTLANPPQYPDLSPYAWRPGSRKWKYACKPCKETRELTGDKPDVAPFCRSGHRMTQVTKTKRGKTK